MSDFYHNKLVARVQCVNELNREINRIQPLLIAAAAPFVGKKCFVKDGGMVVALKKAVDPILDGARSQGFRIWYQNSRYSFCFGLAHSVNVGSAHSCMSAERVFYVGECDGENIKNVSNPRFLPEYFTAEQIEDARAKVRAARETLFALEHNLCGFGEADN